MIAKLISYGKDRNEAIAHMRDALDRYYIRGLTHNIPFLASLLSKDKFVSGNITTNFIAEEYAGGFHATPPAGDEAAMLVLVAAVANHRLVARDVRISGQFPGHEMQPDNNWVVVVGDEYHDVTLSLDGSVYSASMGGKTWTIETSWKLGEPLFIGSVNGSHVSVQLDRHGITWLIAHAGHRAKVMVLNTRTAELHRLMPHKAPPDMSKYLLSPMPGLLRSLEVVEGQEVKAGEALAVVEAMKMENILKAERDGTISKIHATPGESLAVDQKILEFGE
jgi:propionyl-CoA carboxylase alpha chain